MRNISTSTIAEKIYLKDIFGRTIKTFQPNSQKTTIDLYELESGVYFITAQVKNNTETVKIIKQ
jgi:hypothetical protein